MTQTAIPAGGGHDEGRGGRWQRVALAVSVALNLAVVGVVVGSRLRDEPARPVALRDVGFGPYAAALTEEDRAALRRALSARGPELRGARSAMRADMAEVAALLRADPFDAAALRQVMERGAARSAEVIALGRLLLLDHVRSMTPEARRAFADRLDEAARRGPPGRMRPEGRPESRPEGQGGPPRP